VKDVVPERDRVTSRKIMDRLRTEAAGGPRSNVRLATLRRLEEACDDLANGRARQLSLEAGRDEPTFGSPKRPNINPQAIHAYIRLRSRLDAANGITGEASQWIGPHSVTIRADPEGLYAYVKARQAEVLGLPKRRPERTRARRVDEIIAGIADTNDRLQIMDVVEDGYAAARRYAILTAALRKIPEIDIETLISGHPDKSRTPDPEILSALSQQDRLALRRFTDRLQDEKWLAAFGLRYDGRRVRMAMAPGTQLVTMDEFDLLRSLAGDPPA
jgi:hypothetical protein